MAMHSLSKCSSRFLLAFCDKSEVIRSREKAYSLIPDGKIGKAHQIGFFPEQLFVDLLKGVVSFTIELNCQTLLSSLSWPRFHTFCLFLHCAPVFEIVAPEQMTNLAILFATIAKRWW